MAVGESTVDRITAATLDEALAFLIREPIVNAGLIATLGRARSSPQIRAHVLAARDETGALAGVVLDGPQTLLSAGKPEAFEALGEACSETQLVRVIIGPAGSIAAYRAGAQGALLRTPRLDSDQMLMVQHVRAFDVLPRRPHVREALHADRDTIAAGAAEMILAELGYDPRARASFPAEITQQLTSRRWWLAEDDGLRLLCRTGAVTADTITLECVWSPVASRGRGYATFALAQICARLLERRPSVSLAVSSRNEKAIALYERLGFISHGRQRTLLW